MNLTAGPNKCLVHDCKNTSDLGQFIGDVCMPCHKFITTGQGRHSQVYRNGANLFIRSNSIDITTATDELKNLLKTLSQEASV